MRLGFHSPEYHADQQQKRRQHDALVDETQERYRVEPLPDTISVRGALADQGVVDTQLEAAYRRPKNDAGVTTMA